MSEWHKSSDRHWYKIVAELDAKIEAICLNLASGQFCDKWGEPLQVGDEVEYTNSRDKRVKTDQIIAIENGHAVLTCEKVHWSYLVKR